MARWRLAARLAWREVRRRPGRTLLVVLLIAVPVLGMTVGSVLARTDDAESSWARQWGTADLVVTQSLDDDVVVVDHVPVSADVTSGLWPGGVPIERGDGEVSYAELGEAAVAPRLVDTGGRVPNGADEAWVSRPLLDELGLDVGDDLELVHPAGTWEIVGTGRSADWFDADMVLVGQIDDAVAEQFRPDVLRLRTIVDLRPGTSATTLASTGRELTAALPDASWVDASVEWAGSERHVGEVLAWGWVAGALALAVTGIVVAAAFATSARRQLATVGLLSCNGAPERTIRRSLVLQGSWTGVAGAVLGVGAGLLALVVGRPLLDRWYGHALSDYRIAPLDLLVIVVTGVVAASLAALVPARTASRVPVLAALAGRRPLGAVPRGLVPIGLGLFAFGTFLLIAAATGDGGNTGAATAVVGGVLALAGVCCASPLAIDLMSRAASAIGRSWRFAGRSLGRTRTRSAAVVTAIAVTVAAGCVVSSAVAGVGHDDGAGSRLWPADVVVAVVYPEGRYVEGESAGDAGQVDYGPLVDTEVPESVQDAVADTVPGGRWYPRRMATWDAVPTEDNGISESTDASGTTTFGPGTSIVVADPATMDLYELTGTERAMLSETGALLLNSWTQGVPLDGEQVVGRVETEDGALTFPLAMRPTDAPVAVDGGLIELAAPPIYGVDTVMITEDAARDAGFDVVTAGGFWRGDEALTRSEALALSDAIATPDPAQLAWAYRDVPQPSGADPTLSYMYDTPSRDVSGAALQSVAVGGSLVLTLLVVAIGLALAATESRDERDVLVAVGARPGTLRSMAGVKAVVMTATGVALGVPADLIPTFAVTRSTNGDFDMPWVGLAGFVIAVPAVAGAAAWAASSIAQALRPVRMSTLATD